jgi:hypothetical protein
LIRNPYTVPGTFIPKCATIFVAYVSAEGVPATQLGCANVLAIDKIESKNNANSLLAFKLSIFLISEVVDVAMSGCF